ncbi:MAG: M20/M25/M40 family metallo-hydrolase [Bifidobacteriaceae bacterium]|jgi:carboxypeptidase PM20D1|nr:M20/M25/M40 family metallo-hydrolase [Bifidobacteriaceae bacterium]
MLKPIEKLAKIIQIPTISNPDLKKIDYSQFDKFEKLIAELWPLVHQKLEKKVFPLKAIVFEFPGTDKSLEPIVLLAHYDVVPVPGIDTKKDVTKQTAPGWDFLPFAGIIEHNKVYGRGSLDDKECIASILEATEQLLADGFSPKRSILLCFGSDEEVNGHSQEEVIAWMKQNKINPWMVIDEGGAVVDDALPAVSSKMAMVGITEKGVSDIVLIAKAETGHASTPARNGSVTRLAKALVKIEKHRGQIKMSQVVIKMLQTAGKKASGPMKFVYKHSKGLSPLLSYLFAKMGGETEALVRTTTAPTQLQGAPAHNILPPVAKANINVRVITGETIQNTVDRFKKIINDPQIEVEAIMKNDPAPISDVGGVQWKLLEKALHKSHGDVLATPYIMLGGSDARHYSKICKTTYRFSPFYMGKDQRSSLHGFNEYLQIDNFIKGVEFYKEIIKGSSLKN